MIIFRHGDIFKDASEALVNPVNCVGVMGKGLALQFKHRYPDNFNFYYEACNENKVKIGLVLVYKTTSLLYPRFIINFPTKTHWREPSHIEYIEKGLSSLVDSIQSLKIHSIALPSLGCGLGGLNWLDVRGLITERLEGIDGLLATIYEPV